MEIISRKDAIMRGLRKYFTGIPCKNGHVAQRYTVTYTCTACVAGTYLDTRQQVNRAMAGLPVRFTCMAHPGDHADLQGYADALSMQRGLIPQSHVKPLPALPKPVPSRFQMWSRARGDAIALQMLRATPPWSDEERQLLGEAP